MKKYPVIITPRGKIYVNKNGVAVLKWNPSYARRMKKKVTNAQESIDSDILKYSKPYVPKLTGTLIKSGDLGTEIGSGIVRWIAPYANKQYYAKRKVGSKTGALRGPGWADRMLKDYREKILDRAKKKFGGSS